MKTQLINYLTAKFSNYQIYDASDHDMFDDTVEKMCLSGPNTIAIICKNEGNKRYFEMTEFLQQRNQKITLIIMHGKKSVTTNLTEKLLEDDTLVNMITNIITPAKKMCLLCSKKDPPQTYTCASCAATTCIQCCVATIMKQKDDQFSCPACGTTKKNIINRIPYLKQIMASLQ